MHPPGQDPKRPWMQASPKLPGRGALPREISDGCWHTACSQPSSSLPSTSCGPWRQRSELRSSFFAALQVLDAEARIFMFHNFLTDYGRPAGTGRCDRHSSRARMHRSQLGSSAARRSLVDWQAPVPS